MELTNELVENMISSKTLYDRVVKLDMMNKYKNIKNIKKLMDKIYKESERAYTKIKIMISNMVCIGTDHEIFKYYNVSTFALNNIKNDVKETSIILRQYDSQTNMLHKEIASGIILGFVIAIKTGTALKYIIMIFCIICTWIIYKKTR